jgi:hypothetical protein
VLVGRRLAREFTIDGVRFRSKASWSPFRPARFWAESPAGTVLLSSFGQPSGRDVRPNRVPFAPAFNAAAVWVAPVAAVPTSGPAVGTLIVLTTSGGRRGRDAVDPETLVRGAPWVTLLDPHRPTGGPPASGVDGAPVSGPNAPGSGLSGLLPPPGTPGGGAGIMPPPS